MDLSQFPEEEHALVCLLDQGCDVGGPGEVLRDVDSKELEAGDTFNPLPIDMDRAVCAYFVPSEVHDDLFSLACVEGQVVVDASLCQVPDLFPVWRLIVFADEPDHGCIVCKLHDCV